MSRLALGAVLLTIAVPAFAEPQNCAYTLSSLTVTVPAAGGTGDGSVMTGAGCSWTASSDRTWMSVPGNTRIESVW